MDRLVAGNSSSVLFSKIPTIHFYPENHECPACGSGLNVRKTRPRTVITMHIGTFRAWETVLVCPACQTIFISEQLRNLVPKWGNFGFDVIVEVGLALFVHCRNNREVMKMLAAKNVFMSERQISCLGRKFIIYLAIAHQESQLHLRKLMAQRGGYILHVDGTCEGDSPNLFCALDGISELVLDTVKIPSEKKEQLVPFFQRVKDQYGEPKALVHDMGRGIISAVEEVFPGVVDFICHFHFLRDIGKDLFGKEYKVIYDRLKSHGIRTILRRKLKALTKKITDDSRVFNDFKTDIEEGKIETSRLERVPDVATYALTLWIFDAPSKSAGYGFPFDCPHLAFFQRLKVVHSVLKQVTDIHLRNKCKENKPFYRMLHLLDKVVTDEKLIHASALMENKITLFNRLRQALRIALPEGKDGLNDDGEITEMKTIESAVNEFRRQVISDDSLSVNSDYLKMIAQIDKYWKKLFADPITVKTPDGIIEITPQRTNNLLERFFRDLKRNGRKRSGFASLSKMLKTILADTPLVANLKSEKYLETILGNCETLEEKFSQIDAAEVRNQLKKEQQIGRAHV